MRACSLTLKLTSAWARRQIAWNYIISYPFPFIAKSLAANSGNATAINTFYSSNTQLGNYNLTGTVTPNSDTLYNQAFLDLSQVPLLPDFASKF